MAKEDLKKCVPVGTIRNAQQYLGGEPPKVETTNPLQHGDWLVYDRAGNIAQVLSDGAFRERYEVIS